MNPTPEQFRAAVDPATPAATLAELAQHPALQAAVASNPATYPELLDWLRQYGDAAAQAAVEARGADAGVPDAGPAAAAEFASGPASAPAPAPAPGPTGAYAPEYARGYAPAASGAPGARFVEPSRSLALTWGTYETRYLIAVIGVSLAGLLNVVMPFVSSEIMSAIYRTGSSAYTTANLVGALLALLSPLALVAAIIVLPAPRKNKIIAAVLAGAPTLLAQALVLLMYETGMGWIISTAFYVLANLAGPAAVAAWFLARMRPGVSYAVLPVALIIVFFTFVPFGRPSWTNVVIVAILVGMAWLGRVVAANRARSPRAAQYLGASPHAGGYGAPSGYGVAAAPGAYGAPGAPAAYGAPGGYATPGAPGPYGAPGVYGAPVARTNTLAILALVFGLLGGWLGILFGHLALSQIKRTGEQGGGLALAGLILGYTGIGLFLIYVVALLTGRGW